MNIIPADGYILILPIKAESDNIKVLSNGLHLVRSGSISELTRSRVARSVYMEPDSVIYHKLDDVAGEIVIDGVSHFLIHVSDVMAHESPDI